MTRLLFGLIWAVHFLPDRAVAAIGEAAGSLFYRLVGRRRIVTRINLEKCFPGMAAAERERLAQAHFRAFGRSLVDRGILWWGRPERIARMVRVEGLEHLQAVRGAPVVLLAPHFVGLDAGGLRLNMDYPMATMYQRQKDPVFDRLLYRGRSRFGGTVLSRQAGLRPALKAIRAGLLYYYLPDMDLGRRSAVFAPFFGVPAATTVGLAYIARSTGAAVLPCVTRMLPRGGYAVRLYPAWSGFPSGDDAADARRLNAFIEERVLEMPEQYFWLHRRFKTRPEGEARFY